MNKYYIPKLEEFCTGFAYEVLCNPSKVSKNDPAYYLVWSKETFYLNESHIKLIKYVDIQKGFEEEGSIRVKYLDQEDIESLGFRKPHSRGDNFIRGGEFDRDLISDCGDNYYHIFKGTNTEFHFFGKIKNKSELMKILEMLNIEYD